MEVIAEPLTDLSLVQRAASVTAHGAKVRSGIKMWACNEHSPLRAYIWWVAMYGIPYRAAMHLRTHHLGVEHFVSTTRPDFAPDGGEDSKSAPVNHAMLLNAQSLINISRSRLCYKAHLRTVWVMRRVRKAVAVHDPELARWLRPECVYRNGYCPEPKECYPGLENVLWMYGQNEESGYE